MSDLDFHPLSNIFPLITGEEFSSLVHDIKTNGQREAIVLFEGKILDGRNRYRACRECGSEVVTREFEGGDALDYVLSLNMYRRQLTIAQRAVIAAELAVMSSRGAKTEDGIESDSDADDKQGMGIEAAAKLMGISPRSVSSAARVHRVGTPELVEAVKAGVVSVSAAEHLTKLDATEQQEICERGPRAIRKAAREIRQAEKKSQGEANATASAKPAEPDSPAPTIVFNTSPVEDGEFKKKPSIQRFLELAGEGMEQGREAEEVASEILEYLDDGIDTQALLFALDVAERLRTSVALRRFRR